MDRSDLTQKLLKQQKYCCFICERPIDTGVDEIEIDHIVPRARGGRDDENNYAATHQSCNRKKSDADLRIARCMALYERIKEEHAPKGHNRPNLGDFLAFRGGAKYLLRASRVDGRLRYSMPEKESHYRETEIHVDKLSGLEYVFLRLPIEYIYHDSRINPRAVSPRIRGLLHEFLSGRPQLHVALAWGALENGQLRVQVFDGQHKAVAQILLEVKELPVRLFLDPDVNLLLEANTKAGTELRQIAFDQATQRYLGSQLYWEKIDEFRQASGRAADDLNFSEQDLVNFFRGERREVTRYILDDVRIAVVHHPDNKLKDYIEFSGREFDKPLSYSTLEKTAFSLFIRKTPLSFPIDYKLEVGENPRQLEKDQIVRLLNILADTIYINAYDFDLGAAKTEERVRKGEPIPDPHLRAVRISREEVLFNVLTYARALIKQYFLMQGQVFDDTELFQHKFPEELWTFLARLIKRLSELPVWVNKQLSGTVFGAKQDHDYWKGIFETGHDRGGIQVLAKPLNLNELIA